MKDNQDEQLFSELTPAEAAVVEGGHLRVTIGRIEAIQAGADPGGPDDTYIKVNTKKIWGEHSMTTGQARNVNEGGTGSGSSVQVQLFDADWPSRDEQVGGFTAVNTNGDLRRVRVSGSGSTYDVYYRGYAS